MITYKGFSIGEAFLNASQDKVWNLNERQALRDIANGFKNSTYNNLLMVGEIEGR